ncbi:MULTISPECIES: DUF6198 family protein [unclassified Breznakia]|uniref:YczE/YyaS/YitT family protein n=1 Tax=unclassified Breznakia TaxID=2623764 RepID=UPI00247592D6|nr:MULTISPECIES: DUF6198 family protein [unclassified Breznakia]MDH6367595.1 putative membrane protein YczE [Breznakia sp. PH1-1]MDH6404715.1 putative membrane protein YczE [Breznakia sp. PF1-11]MDH6412425.1 putative membrane protein YczE [Breznakia sp. PFB1-11]MDH6414790.1 putative membrane protein YczE [Breznakia sp. PFB1-14]MDH6417096.1 putative membrane protein YczE [Breznakia sp. PFB1-4]
MKQTLNQEHLQVNLSNKILQVRLVISGVIILSLGIACMRYSMQGTDPFVTMNIGIAQTLQVNFGTVQMIANVILLLVMIRYARSMIHLGTFLGVFAVGYLADFMFSYIQQIPYSTVTIICFCAFGLLACCFGAALYMSGDLGIAPYDAFGLIIETKLHVRIPFRWIRIISDCICVTIGFVLGAPIGIGTLITAFCTGPLITYFRTLINQRIKERTKCTVVV